MTDTRVGTIPLPRALAGALEPFAGQVYFSRECHENYEKLGFAASPGFAGRTPLPDGPAYFTSRGSVMGQVPGQLVACAFGVFNPAVVVPAVTFGWSMTDAQTICQARTDGAVAQLQRILGEKPERVERAAELLKRASDGLRVDGRPLYAGLLSQPEPKDALASAWLSADRLREYRGDSHVNAWTTAGLDAPEINLITEPFMGLPMRSYSRTRAWSDAEYDAAEARLEAKGYTRGGALTDEGRAFREGIEQDTDRQCQPIIDNLGDDLDELLGILAPWGAAIRDAGGYLGGGAADLS